MKAKVITLGELVVTQKGFAFKSAWFCDSGRPIVKVKDFTANSVDTNDLTHISEEIGEKHLRYELRTGDVIIQTVGSWPTNPASVVGKCVRIPRSANHALLNQNAVKLTPSEGLENAFLYYALKNPNFGDYIVGTAQGAASQAAVTLDSIRAYALPLPDLPTQRKIAGILSAYDDLIENNLRRIRILEEMAQSLYREWFVHFRFPGHESTKMVDSPLGPIPEGWEVKKLGDIAEDVRSSVPKGNLDQPTPYVGLEHIPRKSLALNDWEIVSELGSNKLIFKTGEILFGKIRPYFHKVSIAPFEGICSADTIVIRAKSPEDTSIVTARVSSEAFVAHATATSNGSKMPRANWKVLVEYPIVQPPKELKAKFSAFFANAVGEQQTLIRRNQTLRQTRDLLLPKLLSPEAN